MKKPSFIIIATIASPLLYFILFSSPILAYDNFECENVRMVNGRIEGEFCNKTSRYFNEVFVNAIAVNYSGKELWTETILVEKIGPMQCSHFIKIADILKRPYKLKFTYFTGQDSEFIDTNNRNQDIYFDNIILKGRELEATICNRSGNTLDDLMISIFGIANNKEIVWRKDIVINELPPADCHEISRHIFSILFEDPSNILFGINKVISNENIKSGRISDEISYKDISFKDKRFKGKICNDSKETRNDVFIRFYALSSKNNIIWNEVVTVDHIERGQCKPFIEYTLTDRKPTKWSFTVSGW